MKPFNERMTPNQNPGQIGRHYSKEKTGKNITLLKVKPSTFFGTEDSLRSWRDFARECFCFGSEAVNASADAVRGLVKSLVEFPPTQIRGVF